jgi:hypothetical protein
MTRGGAQKSKVHFKGKTDDFIIFLDDVEAFKNWQTDKSVPYAHFVSPFKIFVTHKQGAQGSYDSASKSSIASEFSPEDEVLKDSEIEEIAFKTILENGSLQTMEMPERQGTTNDSMSSMRTK